MVDEDPWRAVIENLEKDCPLTSHTDIGRLSSAVRRMKAEKDVGLPLSRRCGFAISVATGKRPSEMTEEEWETFFQALSEQLRNRYPEMHARLFPPVAQAGQ